MTSGNVREQGFRRRGNEFGNLGEIDFGDEGGGFARFIILGLRYWRNSNGTSVGN